MTRHKYQAVHLHYTMHTTNITRDNKIFDCLKHWHNIVTDD